MKPRRRDRSSERGQGMTEYLLMLSCLVGEIMLVSAFMKNMMPKIFDRIEQMICGM